ncbi:MAG: DUF1598 domain-containing protein, partial [Planctomycetia bacterium]|nr:DUF1598 domain-containing protein [Planctomycetia bacterium]
MRRISVLWLGAALLLSLVFTLGLPTGVMAQNNNNNSNNNDSNSDDDDDSDVSTGAGIRISPEGLLSVRAQEDFTGALRQQWVQAARVRLGSDVARTSTSRNISLNRLEAELERNGGIPTEQMRYLAGLIRIRNVYFYPDSNDIVIAGPAEGWITTPQGYVVGMHSNQPVCRLDDLVTALRCYGPDGTKTSVIGCSIDPTAEGLAQMQAFTRSVNYQPGMEGQIAEAQRRSLGLQKVTVNGVAADTHFAQVMVEADYRMKLIGLGLEPQEVGITTFIEKATTARAASNALFRWWFVPDYDCVRVSEDGLAAELVGEGLRLSGADESVATSGERLEATRERIHPASRAFVNSFTQKYPQLAASAPIYAELRNIVDMTIVAALVQKNGYYEKSGWKMGFFGDESKFRCETSAAPQWVEPVVNPIVRKNTLRVPIA